ncbi:MAG: ComEC/Rec2 family competence protein [Cyanobacteria bacterium P01_E01_bin.6]
MAIAPRATLLPLDRFWEHWFNIYLSQRVLSMQANRVYFFCLAYITGLLLTGLREEVYGIPLGAVVLVLGSLVCAVVVPKLQRTAPNAKFWLCAGLIGSLAFIYLHLRTPHPSQTDLSLWQQRISPEAVVTIDGQIVDEPQLTRSQHVRFLLNVQHATVENHGEGDGQAEVEEIAARLIPDETVIGKAYTTVPLLQGTGLYPGEQVAVHGTLYLPESAQNPGSFDFRAYLARKGVFSGLRGQEVTSLSGSPSVLWQMRQRVVRAMVDRLGTPEGTLLSAMVLGRRAVDLPYDIRDGFNQAGLAHTIAASGFHVSLLLSVVMVMAQRFAPQTQCWIGSGVLLLYIGLTGAQPSVIRAGLMGFGALLGAAMERRSKPLAMLLLIATMMLIGNPLWIWDLGFQFSFLATLGLLVLVPALVTRLDWIPTGIATLVAVPIAAYTWVMPIQMAAFGSIPTYSIVLNVLATPLILLISLGGMVSGAIALLLPSVGGFLAWCLQIPITLLIQLVNTWNHLPGNTLTTGSLTTIQLLIIYAVYGVVWWKPWVQKRWWLALVTTIALITAPMVYVQIQQQYITILATSHAPALVVRDRGNVGLIFGGTDADANYTVLPFLRSHGIGRLNWAIALDAAAENTGWPRLTDTVSIQTVYVHDNTLSADDQVTHQPSATSFVTTSPVASSLQQPDWLTKHPRNLTFEPGQQIRAGRIPMQFLEHNPAVLRFQFGESIWMICDRQQPDNPAPSYEPGIADIIWWSGDEIDAPWIEALSPDVAIAPVLNGDIRTHGMTPDTITTQMIQVYETDRIGALQWTPHQGIVPLFLNENPL